VQNLARWRIPAGIDNEDLKARRGGTIPPCGLGACAVKSGSSVIPVSGTATSSAANDAEGAVHASVGPAAGSLERDPPASRGAAIDLAACAVGRDRLIPRGVPDPALGRRVDPDPRGARGISTSP
jgi:hypothetical protein